MFAPEIHFRRDGTGGLWLELPYREDRWRAAWHLAGALCLRALDVLGRLLFGPDEVTW